MPEGNGAIIEDLEEEVNETHLSADPDSAQLCGRTVMWNLESGTLTISGSGEMFDYTWKVDDNFFEYVDTPWYFERENITQIVIEDGVTYIGSNAFADCVNVVDATIADSVIHIGENAFEGCGNINYGSSPMDTGIIPYTPENGDTLRYSVVILDTSDSMSGTPINVQRQVAIKFCESVLAAEGENYVAIVRLNTSSTVGCQFTDDLWALTAYINSTQTSGGTNINQALTVAEGIFSAVPDRAIKNIVLCSDGLPESGITSSDGPYTSTDHSDYRYANTVYNTATLLKEQYKIYSLAFFHSLSGHDLAFGRKLMKDVQNAGYYEVVDPDELEFVFDEIAGDITTDKKTGSFWYASEDDNDYSATYYYDDKYFVE